MGIIEMERVSLFRDGSGPNHVIREVSLSVPEGSCVGLLGGNGAGKSTLFRLLMGLVPMGAGHATIRGLPVPRPASRVGVGYLPDRVSILDHLTGREYLELFSRLEGLGKARAKEAASGALHELHLEHAADTPARRYSKGMLQRLDLGRVFLVPRTILILDEPLTGLDAASQVWFEERLEKLRGNAVTMMLTSHSDSILERLCDRFVVLRGGRLVTQGSKDQVFPVRGWRVVVERRPEAAAIPAGGRYVEGERAIHFNRREDAEELMRKETWKEYGVQSFGEVRDNISDLMRKEARADEAGGP